MEGMKGHELLLDLADELLLACSADTDWRLALAAVAVAAVTGEPEDGAFILEGEYHPEEADLVWGVLEKAARVQLEARPG